MLCLLEGPSTNYGWGPLEALLKKLKQTHLKYPNIQFKQFLNNWALTAGSD